MGYYGNQLKTLVKRNFLLKKYALPTTFIEILMPICMVFVSYIVNHVSETKVYSDVGPTESNDIHAIFNMVSLKWANSSAVPTIGYVLPELNPDESIINRIRQNEMFQNSPLQFHHFGSQDEMNEFNNNYRNLLIAGIVFESEDHFHYTLRVNGTMAPDPSKEVMMDYSLGRYRSEEFGNTDADLYLQIFSPLQTAIDEAIIQEKTNDDTFTMHHSLGKLGRAACHGRQTDNGGNLGFFLSNIYMFPIIVIAIHLVKEKEDGVKEGLLMAGVHPTIFWVSWLVVYVIFSAIISVCITVFFYFTKTFANVHPVLLFLSLFLYGLSCCSLAFILSTFFKKSKTAGATVAVVIVSISCSNMFSPFLSRLVRKIASIFLCPVTLGSLIYEIDGMEDQFLDLTFGNLFHSPAGYFFMALIFNNVLYFVLAILFDNLFSNEGSRYLSIFNRHVSSIGLEGERGYEQDIQEDWNESHGETCMVEVRHVHKVFTRKKKSIKDSKEELLLNHSSSSSPSSSKQFLAVNDVSFKVYQNEIFGILGHNGAGKTTLINIMVGLLKASEGDVYFDGRSIGKNTNDIRKDFGVCAQYNTIFEQLTVEEHIKFYAQLKNIKVNVDEVLSDIDLLHQKKTKAAKLSGGQKRKLCIGMATIGDPKYVFLDEPTTGLDPLSRRKIWDLLLKKKKGRVIFLTTHYMDEADILADRKLIISKGKIRCLGTSLYLKNHFNMNYDLDIETQDKDAVQNLIQKYLPEATYDSLSHRLDGLRKESDKDRSCHTWKLPLHTTDRFPLLLNALDEWIDHPEHPGLVKSYALNMPTLEELFIRLEDQKESDDSSISSSHGSTDHVIIPTHDADLPKLEEVRSPSPFLQMLFLIKSRFKIFLTDKDYAFFAVIFPALVNGMMFIVSQKVFLGKPKPSSPNILSIPTMYNNTLVNIEPPSQFPFSPDQLQSALSLSDPALLTHYPLYNITYPGERDPYTLVSLHSQPSEGQGYDFQIHYNDTMLHSVPATLNALSNAILASKNISESIVVTSHLYDTESFDAAKMVGLCLSGFMVGYSVVANINRFDPLVVRERELQLVKQLQLNGVSRTNYWISSFFTDLVLFVCSCLLIFLVGVVVRFEPLMDVKILGIILALFLVWSVPTMLYQYVISFFFEKEASAFSSMPMFNTYPVLFGYLIFILINNNYNVYNGIQQGEGVIGWIPNLYNVIVTIIFPGYGLIAMINSLFTMRMFETLIHYDISLKHLFQWENGISPILVVLAVLTVVLLLLLVRLDSRKSHTQSKDIAEVPAAVAAEHQRVLDEGDEDVRQEYHYVQEHGSELPLSVLHLSKEYKTPLPKDDKLQRQAAKQRDPIHYEFGEIHRSPISHKYVKTAVMDVSFGVRNHECFGLLGPNGAGKSTTLNTITATLPQTTGKICYKGVESHLVPLGDLSLGYCPQNDILWKELTLREHLELFLRVRGYSARQTRDYATQYIRALDLEEHQHKRADNLSGGTKRKLSLLIAICGYPQQIFLDEPSAGMDPSTRRFVWETIKKTKNVNDSAVIMTTHSMEEAEYLCDRLAILVNGRLSCIGSPEHLKMKFGDSYLLELQSPRLDQFHQDLVESGRLFGPGVDYTVEKTTYDRAKYQVKMTRHLGHVFTLMEECKTQGLVIDYSFNQVTLEQVFIQFAQKQIISPN